MPLSYSPDTTPADWIVDSEIPWGQLVGFGPPAFPAYARLRFMPDPAYPGQSEHEVPDDGDHDDIPRLWSALFEVLASHTETPEDCFFCLWDGWPLDYTVRQLPTLTIVGEWGSELHPVRNYYLFRGPLSAAGEWGEDFSTEHESSWEPAFVWPADRAWCVAKDVDPHYAGIGAQSAAIEQLIADTRLDAVAADPTQDQPDYQ